MDHYVRFMFHIPVLSNRQRALYALLKSLAVSEYRGFTGSAWPTNWIGAWIDKPPTKEGETKSAYGKRVSLARRRNEADDEYRKRVGLCVEPLAILIIDAPENQSAELSKFLTRVSRSYLRSGEKLAWISISGHQIVETPSDAIA